MKEKTPMVRIRFTRYAKSYLQVSEGGQPCVTAGRTTEGSEACGERTYTQQASPKGANRSKMRLLFAPILMGSPYSSLTVHPNRCTLLRILGN